MKRALTMRRLIPAILLLALSLTLVVGTVYAYMFMRTQEETAAFAPAVVSCSVSEDPFYGTTKSGITVTNTGNVDAYLRVRLVTYWIHGEGENAGKVAAESSPALPMLPINDGWIRGGDNTFYYESPVEPYEVIPSLFSGSITLGQKDGLKQVIDVFAEAIQADPAAAVIDSWDVTLDSSGTITGTTP